MVRSTHINKTSEILVKIQNFFKNIHLKILPAKCQPFCLDINVSEVTPYDLGVGFNFPLLKMSAISLHLSTLQWCYMSAKYL